MGWWLALSAAWATETVLVAKGADWTYIDTGVEPAASWNQQGFDDSGWDTGAAALGYGLFGLETVIEYGPDPDDKPVTVWFRHEFQVVDLSDKTAAVLGLRADDGAIVYLNGVEVHRYNMPAGPIDADTPSLNVQDWALKNVLQPTVLDVGDLVEGTNTLAIEVHNSSPSSYDLVLDAALSVHDGPGSVVRGPYLQQGTHDGIVVKWRTEGPSPSTVWYGALAGALDLRVDDPTFVMDHEVQLTGLGADSTWFYAVGEPDAGMLAGDDPNHTFRTLPAPGPAAPVQLWVLGDSGTANANARAVRDAYYAWSGGVPPTLMVMLGDNAYNSGTDEEYQDAVFDMYPGMLRRTALWSTIGNHDTGGDSLVQTDPYFDIFTLPTQGEAGGAASGTEAYYSFDVANVHLICLDSWGSDRSPDAAMLQWLSDDLATTQADWIIAFWHHPPYSKGSHNSDTEQGLVDMRENALPLLEAHGVDLVLAGHSHSYERSILLDSHYDRSDTLEPWMLRDEGAGNPLGGGAYRKPTAGLGPNEGSVYVVAGSSGKISNAPLNHPVMHIGLVTLGSVVLEIDGDELTATFIDDGGNTPDVFAIHKGLSAILTLDGPRVVDETFENFYTAYAQHPDGIEADDYVWDFGDNSDLAYGSNVSHIWASRGYYDLSVTVTGSDGQPVTRTTTIEVQNIPPVLEPLVPPAPTLEGTEVSLSAVAWDPTGDPVTISWDMGDGTLLEGDTVVHAWPDDGPWLVTVTASDDGGAEVSDTMLVLVDNVAPVLEGVTHTELWENTPIVFTPIIDDPGSWDTHTVIWDALDGTEPVEGPTWEHVFPDEGHYAFQVDIEDDDGGKDSAIIEVDIVNAPPRIDALAAPSSGTEGAPVTFAVAATDPGGDPFTIVWDFGDGASALGDFVEHTYRDDGDWLASVTLDDGRGGVTVETLVVAIANQPPRIESVGSPTTGLEGSPLIFTATAVDPGLDDVVVISWVVEQQVLLGPAVSWTFADEGAYQVVLHATDDDGGDASMVLSLGVQNAPPRITSLPPVLEVRAADEFVYAALALDPGDDVLTWTLAGPAGASVDDAGIVRWRPADDQAGDTVWFVLRVTDDSGATAEQTFPLTVGDDDLSRHDRARRDGNACSAAGGTGSAGWVLCSLAALAWRRRRATG